MNKTELFLQKLKDKGFYNEDYDYSKVNYIDSKTKVFIINKKSNVEHCMLPHQLLKGCKLTSNNVLNKNEYFIKRSKKIH